MLQGRGDRFLQLREQKRKQLWKPGEKLRRRRRRDLVRIVCVPFVANRSVQSSAQGITTNACTCKTTVTNRRTIQSRNTFHVCRATMLEEKNLPRRDDREHHHAGVSYGPRWRLEADNRRLQRCRNVLFQRRRKRRVVVQQLQDVQRVHAAALVDTAGSGACRVFRPQHASQSGPTDRPATTDHISADHRHHDNVLHTPDVCRTCANVSGIAPSNA